MTLLELIRARLATRGLGAAELATLAGWERQTVHNLLAGGARLRGHHVLILDNLLTLDLDYGPLTLPEGAAAGRKSGKAVSKKTASKATPNTTPQPKPRRTSKGRGKAPASPLRPAAGGTGDAGGGVGRGHDASDDGDA